MSASSSPTSPSLTIPAAGMRSVFGFAGSLTVLAGVVIGLSSAIILNAGGSEILHLALGGGFALLALAVFDFRLLALVKWAAAVPTMALAAIFTLQGLAEITQSALLVNIAYAGLGQIGEKVLGDIFIAWCVALVFFDSSGRTRWLGFATLAVIAAVEVYFYAMRASGGDVNDALKLLYVPLFVWLSLESWKRRAV
jgi:hypothetical protein